MIYLDNAATTRPKKEVIEAMLPYLSEDYGNPSSVYQMGNAAKAAITSARQKAASLLHIPATSIYFTSGGSESDNWVLQDCFHRALLHGEKHPHIITSSIEHPAILNTCHFLEELGAQVTYLPVDSNGFVNPEDVKTAIRPETVLISIMTANNEIGTIEPIHEVGEIAKEAGIPFHTDAVQAFGQIPMDLSELPVDFLSASGHKIYGPKGVGLLYIREGLSVRSLIHGGGQERNRRAGTENVAGIVGFGKACELAEKTLAERMEQESSLSDYLIERLLSEIPGTRLNGDSAKRLPNNVNVIFPGLRGESILISLDIMGIEASSGSACTAGSLDPSHVLLALGLSEEEARGELRLTLSDETTKEEIDTTVNALKKIVSRLSKS
ncbi:MAG: cysteine desulfurase family protein [Lachnospiraceae bacterium]|nr:cysteine desulfurase family protein [Lachnospiraceae bacterium]